MKNLIKAISGFPVYTIDQWQAIIKLNNGPHSKNKNDLLQHKSIIAEMRTREIYTPLLAALDKATLSFIPLLAEFSNRLKQINEAREQINIEENRDPKKRLKSCNGEELPQVLEGMLGDLDIEQLINFKNRILSLSSFIEVKPAYIAAAGEAVTNISPATGFHSVGEACCHLTALVGSIDAKIVARMEPDTNDVVVKNSDIEKTIAKVTACDSIAEEIVLTESQLKAKTDKETTERRRGLFLQEQLDLVMATKNEVSICNLMNTEMEKYKAILRAHIKAEFKNSQQEKILFEYSNTNLILCNGFQTDPIEEIYKDLPLSITERKVVPAASRNGAVVPVPYDSDLADNKKVVFEFKAGEAVKKQLQQLVINKPNLARVIANYHLVSDAQKKLNSFTEYNELETGPDRLRILTAYYPDLQKQLKDVGNSVVDNATKSFLDFFKRIWAKIKWNYTSIRKDEMNFTSRINQYSALVRKLAETSKRQATRNNEDLANVPTSPHTSMRNFK